MRLRELLHRDSWLAAAGTVVADFAAGTVVADFAVTAVHTCY